MQTLGEIWLCMWRGMNSHQHQRSPEMEAKYPLLSVTGVGFEEICLNYHPEARSSSKMTPAKLRLIAHSDGVEVEMPNLSGSLDDGVRRGTSIFKVSVRFRPRSCVSLAAATQEQRISQPKANKRVPFHASQGRGVRSAPWSTMNPRLHGQGAKRWKIITP
jgi:hypothetical protein